MSLIDLKAGCFILAAFGLSGMALAETAEEAASNPEHIYPDASDLDGTEIEHRRSEYLGERSWSLGFHDNNPSGGYIGWGTADIALVPEDRDYGSARISAVDAAIAEAMGDFALSKGTNVSLERVREIFQDFGALDDLEEPSNEQFLQAIEARLKDLTAAQLDNALRELGVNPGRHEPLELAQRRTLALESVQTQILRNAREYFQGIRVLKTFEEEGSVGVLVIYSAELRQMAQRILSGRIEAQGSGQSSDALDRINGGLDAEQLLFMHGTRLLRDSSGNPVIVSFGQASPSVTRGDSRQRINMAVSASQRRANMRADGSIAEFLDSYVEVSEEDMSGMASEIIGEKNTDGREREIEAQDVVKKMQSTIRQRSQIDLTGIQTVRTWRANHPDTGHLHVGAVKMWSPASQASFTGLPSMESTPAEEGEEDVSTRQSPEFGEEDW
jgi:hypothetical protein